MANRPDRRYMISAAVIPPNQMAVEHWNLQNRPRENMELIEWFAERGLIANSCTCEVCNIMMPLVPRRNLDTVEWRCSSCYKRRSIRRNSFFSRSHLSFSEMWILLYGWASDFPQNQIQREADLGGPNTLVDWCNFCRELCRQHLERHPALIGGLDEETLTPKIVEVDESLFFRRKYNRGRWNNPRWVFGGIERDSGNCFLVLVPDRTAVTLSAAIQRHIAPGTIIMTDGWQSYQNIDQVGGGVYEHRVVIHNDNFIAPDDPNIHTQNIENMWMRAKKKLRRQCGTSEALLPSYLHEFAFRNKYRGRDIFNQILLVIREEHQV